MAGLLDHLSSLFSRRRGVPPAETGRETASVAASRLGVSGRPPIQQRVAEATNTTGGGKGDAIGDLRRAMAAADQRQARTDADASLLLSVLLSKGHGLNRTQAVQLHEDLMRGCLCEEDRKKLRVLYKTIHGREFSYRIPAPAFD
ncbi:hypothetical protein N825_04135 [Skermanella stibiiresistens SB22]|uniref:Uncharacterized protein n=1 Tax=Skermanella stibiiresistens SB22 TaxID=1385369 RepID=W9H1E4_9PROT|nr:hypothetical protein [Skermanella stibiiresistens]EWY39889.1 hypothetical protein N825_04135 [Skermanella stibiiresistens SB22]